MRRELPRSRDAALTLVAVFFYLLLLGAGAQALQDVMQAANPFAGKRLYVDPNSAARRQAETWRRTRPADAALIARIAGQPVARWFGSWVADVRREVNQAVKTIAASGALPVFVAYPPVPIIRETTSLVRLV